MSAMMMICILSSVYYPVCLLSGILMAFALFYGLPGDLTGFLIRQGRTGQDRDSSAAT